MTDEEFRDLKERTSLIAQITSQAGWDLLKDRVVNELYIRQRRLIRGGAKDYEDYKAECAWMDGVSWVIELPQRIETELENELQARKESEEDDSDSSSR